MVLPCELDYTVPLIVQLQSECKFFDAKRNRTWIISRSNAWFHTTSSKCDRFEYLEFAWLQLSASTNIYHLKIICTYFGISRWIFTSYVYFPPFYACLFYFYIFQKKIYRNIFFVLDFTVIYPWGGRDLYVNKNKNFLRRGPWRVPAAPLPGGRIPPQI